MQLHGFSGAIQCRAFATTLRGAASGWFRTIPPNTVCSFAHLTALFGQRFPSTNGRLRREQQSSYEALSPTDEDESPLSPQPTPRRGSAPLGEGPSQSPFSHAILEEPLPPNSRLPSLPIYNGSGDPIEHAQRCHDILQVHGFSDALQCRLFPTTLRGAASGWFFDLAPNSVDSFTRIVALLAQRFPDKEDQGREKRKRGHLAPRSADSAPLPKRNTPLTTTQDVVLKAAQDQGLLPGTAARGVNETEGASLIASLVRQGHLLEFLDIGRLLDWAGVHEFSAEGLSHQWSSEEEA